MKTISIFATLAVLATPVAAQEAASVAAPSAWKNRTGESVAMPAWSRLFRDDDQLAQLVRQALHSNPGLEQAAARVAHARAVVTSTAAGLYPFLNGSGGIGRARGSAFGQMSQGRVPDAATEINIAASVSWEADLWGRVRDLVRSAKSDLRAAEYDAGQVRVVLAMETAATLFALRSLDEETSVLDQTVNLRRDALKIARDKVQAGISSELEAARFEAELAAAEADAAALKGPRARLENALATLTGQPPAEFHLKRSSLGSLPEVPVQVPSLVIAQRPDLSSARESIESALAALGAARKTWLPSIQLGGQTGFQANEVDAIGVDDENRFWSVSLTASIPLFDAGKRQAGIDSAAAAHQARLAGFQEQLLTAFREVEDALASSAALQEQAAAAGRAAAASSKAEGLATQRYRDGLSSYLEVIEAERSNLASQRAVVQTRGQRFAATVQLIRALGGSWDAAPQPVAAPVVAPPVEAAKVPAGPETQEKKGLLQRIFRRHPAP